MAFSAHCLACVVAARVGMYASSSRDRYESAIGCVSRIVLNRFLKLPQAVVQCFSGSLVPEIPSAEECLIGPRLDCRNTLEPGLGLGSQFDLDLARDCRRHIALDR